MFTPGTVVSEFTSTKGNKIVFRFPVLEDVQFLTNYINELSREDTFVTMSGEQITFAEEEKIVKEWLEKIVVGEKLVILGFLDEELVSVGSVAAFTRRSKHVGALGISVAKPYRHEGIGSKSLTILLELSKMISLQMIELIVYSLNTTAQSLYKKLGFKEVGRVPKKVLFRGELIDEIIMVKFL